jgi:hypothetical protein
MEIEERSLLPGIEELLDKKDLSDLFAFLCLDKPPDDPTARPIPGAPPISKRGGGD